MRSTLSRAALPLFLLLALSPSGRAATLNAGSLQGSYSFVLYKVDTTILGPVFINALGTITFDGNGGAAVQGSINRNGAIQALSSSAAYSLDPQGRLQLSISNVPLSVSGSISFDLDSLLATSVTGPPNSLSQEILLAVRLPATPIAASALSGRYFLVQQTITATAGSPQRENSSGTAVFDGAGSYTLEERVNRNGTVITLNSSGTYQVNAGIVTLNLSGRPSITLAFAPGAAFGVGATLSEQSANTFNLFVLSKADTSALGSAALGGAFELAVTGVAVAAEGFSTSAGRILFFGDGRAFYELQKKLPGAVEPAEGNSTVEVAANGGIQFSAIPNVSGVLQGGLGASARNLAAAAVGDPAVHNLMVAIRTPAAPAAASNAASFLEATALSPGALFSLFGTNLARQTVLASSLPLPKQMGGATVKFNGIEAPLHFVSPFQVNAQVPFEVSTGTAEITVALDGAEGGSLEVPVNAAGPGIFTSSLDGKGPGIFLHGSDFSLVTGASPARPGEVILIYGTGFGAVLPSVSSGAAAPGDPLANVSAGVTVQIGGTDSGVSFAGLAPGFVGLYQINAEVPPVVTPDGAVIEQPVIITVGGVQSNTVTIPVQSIGLIAQ